MNETEYLGPNRWNLLVTTLKALKNLGGSGRNDEIRDEIITSLSLTDEIVDYPHGDGSQTEFEYNLAWTRTLLKYINFIENSSKGVWVLTALAQKFEWEKDIIKQKIDDYWKERKKFEHKIKKQDSVDFIELEDEIIDNEELELNWREGLMNILKSLSPYGFENLTQRLLREIGFNDVKVTKKSHDGGLDGKGILRLSNIVSVPIIFECKRYSTPVGAEKIRNFRGAMEGRADRGLFITTSTFTREAINESRREGAKLIDLIDGEQFIDLLKDYNLGITKEIVERIKIKKEWFEEYL